MQRLKELLKDYEIYTKMWKSDMGEGHLFLAIREELIPYEDNKKVLDLDLKVLNIVEKDKSKGSDRLFLNRLKGVVLNNLKNIILKKRLYQSLIYLFYHD